MRPSRTLLQVSMHHAQLTCLGEQQLRVLLQQHGCMLGHQQLEGVACYLL